MSPEGPGRGAKALLNLTHLPTWDQVWWRVTALRPGEVGCLLSSGWEFQPQASLFAEGNKPTSLSACKEVLLLLLCSPVTIAPISCIFMADSSHIELVRDAPLPDICPACKRRRGSHSHSSTAELRASSFLIVLLQELSPLISFPIFGYNTLLIYCHMVCTRSPDPCES